MLDKKPEKWWVIIGAVSNTHPGVLMPDQRILNFAKILIDHSADIQPGDRVLLEGTTAAEPLIQTLYEVVLERGGHPHPLFELTSEKEALLTHGNEEQLKHRPPLRELAYNQFESRIKIHSETDLHTLANINPEKQSIRTSALGPILATQIERGAAEEFKWVTTLFPTQAYADQAKMSLSEFEDFVYAACHVDGNTDDPIAYWRSVEKKQARIVDRFAGHDKVIVRGPNVGLTLSIKDRIFINSWGRHNMPDGEVHTSPNEDSVNGWVRYTYPAIKDGLVVEGIELTFVDGRVDQATATISEDYLLKQLETDPGARYVGEFAIGTNYEINRFTGNILFDEKIGGSFHMAVGAGYTQTGSKNTSAIHWDMICDLRKDSEIILDGEVVYKNGKFVF
jgi:aminopeptidase